ncbi:MAG: hypothetical protein AVDCRST_MAG93-3895 [uncultured Chloroflexia bacterium]|uniref:Uncharacterized protein n=1 Tax=uncultured Chloroflexia bacterium TaxID=1672391 RepID=A0A6J4JZ04_9CHLR|nr:MAG: hypothetical protein AVDCRST_MAG93-3895 [uncultured Chloroflexia bacterium]
MLRSEALREALDALDGPLADNPYRVISYAMRRLCEPQEAVYEGLLRFAQERGDDEGVIFEVLYGDGSVLGTSAGLQAANRPERGDTKEPAYPKGGLFFILCSSPCPARNGSLVHTYAGSS